MTWMLWIAIFFYRSLDADAVGSHALLCRLATDDSEAVRLHVVENALRLCSSFAPEKVPTTSAVFLEVDGWVGWG